MARCLPVNPKDAKFRFRFAAYVNVFRIVGVVRDATYGQPREPARPMVFVPLAQYVTAYKEDSLQKLGLNSHFIASAMLVMRSDPGVIEPVLRKTFAEVDPNLTIVSVRTMQEQVAMNFDQERAVASLAGLLGAVALVLAAIGLYGVHCVHCGPADKRNRRADGARSAQRKLAATCVRGAFQKVGLGLLLGIPLAIGAGRLIAAQLYGVASRDPLALAAATLSLAAWHSSQPSFQPRARRQSIQ